MTSGDSRIQYRVHVYVSDSLSNAIAMYILAGLQISSLSCLNNCNLKTIFHEMIPSIAIKLSNSNDNFYLFVTMIFENHSAADS